MASIPTPAVIELPPGIPDAVPVEAPVVAPVTPAQPASPVTGVTPAAPPSTTVPTEAEAAKLLSDAYKADQGAQPPATPGAPAAPGTITIDPATLTPELRAVWEQARGDVAQFLVGLSKLGVPVAAPVTEPVEPTVVEPELVEPEPVTAPPPLTTKVLNEIVGNELMRDPTYAAIDQAYRNTEVSIGKIDQQIGTHQSELARYQAGLTLEPIKGDPVLKAEAEAQVREHRDAIAQLKGDRRDMVADQKERLKFHNERDADIRSRIVEQHQRRTQEAGSYAEFIKQRDGYTNQFVQAWPSAVQAAAVQHRIPPEMIDARAQLEARASLLAGIAIEDIRTFVHSVGQKISNEQDALGRVRAGQYAGAAQTRAAVVAGAPPAPGPSIVPAPGSSPTPAPGTGPRTVADAERLTQQLLRQNVMAAR